MLHRHNPESSCGMYIRLRDGRVAPSLAVTAYSQLANTTETIFLIMVRHIVALHASPSIKTNMSLLLSEPSRSPRRTPTEPLLEHIEIPKRIVVFCDGCGNRLPPFYMFNNIVAVHGRTVCRRSTGLHIRTFWYVCLNCDDTAFTCMTFSASPGR